MPILTWIRPCYDFQSCFVHLECYPVGSRDSRIKNSNFASVRASREKALPSPSRGQPTDWGTAKSRNSTGHYFKPTLVVYQHRKIHCNVTQVAYSINEAPFKRLREKPTSDEMLLLKFKLFTVSDCTRLCLHLHLHLGEKAFRVGFKPHPFSTTTPPTVLFMTSNLNKVGIKVFKVLFCDGFTSKFKQMDLDTRNGDVTGCLQLFTASFNSFRMLESVLVRQYPRRLIFEIHFTGIVENYQFQERDCLLKNQMWSSVLNQIGTDFEFVAAGRSFPVHKYVLVARSPIFAAKFSSDTHVKKEENVSAASMEQFLKFIYSGELEEPMNDPDLLQLATDYKIKTLESLCRFASHVVNEDEIMKFAMQFRPGASDSHPHIM